ncbi:MAG: helix-turn-helix domain-containing protein [Acidimicrobiia bacterium]|nr:helix-turn-helix domain-containing protein [Acidimicrobiia bacterium]
MTFRVLGTVGVETAGGVVVEVRGNPRALLAALCVAPNRPRPADVLIDAVWGEAGVPKSTLHVELSRLRRWLRDQGVDDRVIETTGDGYLLRVATDELDATLLLDLVHRGREALEAAETERAQTFLDRAVELVGVP